MTKPLTSAERVYQDLRRRIIDGAIKPNQRLVHRDLAAEFGVSNTPVIDALRRLERDGLIVNQPNWGAAVREWTTDDIEALYKTRTAIESHACRLFAERATRVERLILAEYCGNYEEVLDKGRSERIDADTAFHMYIVQAARCQYLSHVAEATGVIALAFSSGAEPGIPLRPDSSIVDEHRRITAALLEGDANEAEEAARCHVEASLEAILDALAGLNGRPNTSEASAGAL
jgi:DNA-binding GntR family transcriptional regulator